VLTDKIGVLATVYVTFVSCCVIDGGTVAFGILLLGLVVGSTGYPGGADNFAPWRLLSWPDFFDDSGLSAFFFHNTEQTETM
jgi:hypothetical protein